MSINEVKQHAQQKMQQSIDAFKNEVWKGIVGFLCGLYLLYYAIAEYQAANKWLIVGIWLAGGIIGSGIMMASGLAGIPHTTGPLTQ